MQNTINQRFKIVRTSLGLTQTDVAKQLGITPQAISKYEKDGVISSASIKSYCISFNVNQTWLETGNGEIFSDGKQPVLQPSLQMDWKEEAYQQLKQQNEWLKRMLELALGEKQWSKLLGNNNSQLEEVPLAA